MYVCLCTCWWSLRVLSKEQTNEGRHKWNSLTEQTSDNSSPGTVIPLLTSIQRAIVESGKGGYLICIRIPNHYSLQLFIRCCPKAKEDATYSARKNSLFTRGTRIEGQRVVQGKGGTVYQSSPCSVYRQLPSPLSHTRPRNFKAFNQRTDLRYVACQRVLLKKQKTHKTRNRIFLEGRVFDRIIVTIFVQN